MLSPALHILEKRNIIEESLGLKFFRKKKLKVKGDKGKDKR